MMEHNDFCGDIGSSSHGAGCIGKGTDGFIDRSKVRILLCENDTKSLDEVFTLLLKCSYQVISVRSARQVIDALNAEGPDIDIILAEIDLPMAKGMKMLKYIMRDKDLRRIPVIMMSAGYEVSVVVKCLRLGASDYLVKPLRTNELLNLWTHMWRRRRMLGLADKNVFNYEFDLVASDPSDANTNSTTLISDDTDDKSRRSSNPEIGLSTPHEDVSNSAIIPDVEEPPITDTREYRPDVPGISDRRTEQLPSGPKKSELKIGESSAFFTYVKSCGLKNNSQGVVRANGDAAQHLQIEEMLQPCCERLLGDTQMHQNVEAWENYSRGDGFPRSGSIPNSLSLESSCTPPVPLPFSQERNSSEEQTSHVHMHPGNKHQLSPFGFPAQNVYPYYMPGMLNPLLMSPSAQLYQKNVQELQNRGTSAMLSQYNNLSQCHPHVPGMTSLPYYPMSICLQPGQLSTAHQWPSVGSSSATEAKSTEVDRREAALIKFRQKRKERCFDKKIRYVNRKQLAERRPRVRGQFVRKVNGVNVDLHGQPTSADFDEDEDDYEEQDSSPYESTGNKN